MTAQPGFLLHPSNRLERLADRLAQITSEPLRSPFASEVVVVQSNGMRRWLAQQLAERSGICANVQFPFPQTLFNDLISAAFPKSKQTMLYDREVMTWRVLQLLPALAGQAEFAPVARYLDDGRSALRRFQLARQIAHAFDQYLVFRPEMVLRWDEGEGNDWQPILWRKILSEASGQHQVALAGNLAEVLSDETTARNFLPERLSVFGLSTLPPFYIYLLERIAALVPVHLFVLEPTPEWWGDIQSEREKARHLQPELFDPPEAEEDCSNALLAASGKLGRDFLNLIFDLDVDQKEGFEEPSRETMLGAIQHDIFKLRDPAPAKNRIVLANDPSLQFHACHSPMRELEVLRDQLLALFDQRPALKPQDIVVMMPDVASYAPFIDAVFGVPEDPKHEIPYTIADRSARAASGEIDAFFRLLELLPGRLTASEVMALLESPAVQRRFKIETSEIETIRQWVEATSIRWGMDEDHRRQLELPAFADNTWRQGFDRMLLGAVLLPTDRELCHGILPFDQIEGSRAELLGRFLEFAEQLFARARDFRRPRSLADWRRDLLATLAQFLLADESGERELNQLRSALTRLKTIADESANDDEIVLSVVVAQLEASLAESSGGAGFLSGAMTFCALKPMRSIPFSVVCLLGMDDTAYPRHERTPSFNLIGQNPKRGDRHRRDDDRALFLEALLSARDVFYVSYIGRSLRDNKALPPSVLVSELIDYAERSFDFGEEKLVVEHALQAFSPRYFKGDKRRFSFSADNFAASGAADGARNSAPELVPEPLAEAEAAMREVDLAQLSEFLVNPSKFFLRKALRILLPRDEETLEDQEPFALAPLDRYALAQELLDAALEGKNLESALPAVQAAGRLPPGEAGVRIFGELCGSARAFVEALGAQATSAAAEPLEVDQQIGAFRFTARVDGIRDGLLVQYRLAKLQPKDYLRLWLKHLARNLVGEGSAKLFGGGGKIERVAFRPVADAGELLGQLLELYWQGLREPVRFFPQTSWAFMKNFEEGETAARNAARAAWFGSARSRGGDIRDAFIDFAFHNVDDPLDAKWEATTKQILQPLFAHKTE